MRLRIGLGPAGKVFTVVVCVFISSAALVLTGHATHVSFLGRWLPVEDIPADFGIWNTVIAAGVLLACGAEILHAFRYGVRLDGTTVTVRGLFTTSTVNLAAAHQFWFEHRKEQTTDYRYDLYITYFAPLLCVRDRHGTARIPLSYCGRPLPKSDYRALAVAIFKGQRHRSPEAAAQASQAIRALGGRLPAQHV